MRRRKLRTTLTLATITTLVVALVLLTTSTAFEFSLTEPQETVRDRASTASRSTTRPTAATPCCPRRSTRCEGQLADQALVLRRDYVNYGYDGDAENGGLYAPANGQRPRALPPGLRRPPMPGGRVPPARARRAGPATVTTSRTSCTTRTAGPSGSARTMSTSACCPAPWPSNSASAPATPSTFMSQPLTVLGIWDARVVKRDRIGPDRPRQERPADHLAGTARPADRSGRPADHPAEVRRGRPGRAEPPAPRRQHRHHHPAAALPRGPPHPAGQHLVADRHSAMTPTRIAGTGRATVSKKVMNIDVYYRYSKDGQDRIETDLAAASRPRSGAAA